MSYSQAVDHYNNNQQKIINEIKNSSLDSAEGQDRSGYQGFENQPLSPKSKGSLSLMSEAQSVGVAVAKKMILNIKYKPAVTYGNHRKKSMQSRCHQRFKLLGYKP